MLEGERGGRDSEETSFDSFLFIRGTCMNYLRNKKLTAMG